MGTVTYTIPPIDPGAGKPESHGGVKIVRRLAKCLMGATYATGGDELAVPSAPPGGTLASIAIHSAPSLPAGISLRVVFSTSAPKIMAMDEDNTSGIEAELSNGNAALVAQVVWVEFVWTIGV